jgi:hypothetical protein
VVAGRLHPLPSRLEDLHGDGLCVAATHLGHAGADEVAGKAPADEDDEAVRAGDPASAVGKRGYAQLELLAG